jgi:hypothetical protein
MEHSVRELILEINDSHGRSISTLKRTVENKGKTIFSVKNNTDLYLGFGIWFICEEQGKHLQ